MKSSYASLFRLATALLTVSLTPIPSGQLFAQDFAFIAPNTSVQTAGPGASAFELDFSIWQQDTPTLNVTGFSMAVAHDPAVLCAVDVVPSAYIESLHDGQGPSFFGVSLQDEGWTVGVVFSIHGVDWLPFPVPEATATVSYMPMIAAPAVSALTWVDLELGDPAVFNTIVTGGNIAPVFFHGLVQLVPLDFLRGDCDRDGQFSLNDVFLLEFYLFISGGIPGCLSACDTNGSDTLDLADVIYLLNFMFLGGSPPASPFPDCGPAVSALGCEGYWACP